jgi:hypothetical protein
MKGAAESYSWLGLFQDSVAEEEKVNVACFVAYFRG